MKKLVVSMNVSLDGFISGPDGELTWQFPYWNSQMSDYAIRLLAASDAIVMGKRTYQSMAPYWPLAPDDTFARMMNNYSKLIFSRSLKSVKWKNARLAEKNIKSEISALKKQSGKNIIIYGSGSIVRSCIRLGLIDEYYIWLHPVIIGKGNRMFRDLRGKSYLGLEQIEVFDSGVVVLKYLANPLRGRPVDAEVDTEQGDDEFVLIFMLPLTSLNFFAFLAKTSLVRVRYIVINCNLVLLVRI